MTDEPPDGRFINYAGPGTYPRGYVMTGSEGTASVTVTNGTVNSEITVEVAPPMAPQNSCTVVGSPLKVYVWVQQ